MNPEEGDVHETTSPNSDDESNSETICCRNVGATMDCASGSDDDHQPRSTSFLEAEALRGMEVGCLRASERERLFDEIHGVAEQIEETPEFVLDCLDRFRDHLSRTARKPAYNRARLMSPSYVDDPSLHLMALRAERFSPSLAAARYASHFELKLDLFGPDLLVRPITRADLTEDDVATAEAGYFQILPRKDRAGRSVAVIAQEHQEFATLRNKYRMMWYLMMKAIENDEGIQREGFVGVVYNVGVTRPIEFLAGRSMGMAPSFVSSILGRFVAVHYCYDSIRLHPALAVFQFSLGRHIRLRFRSHFGSHTEAQYALLSFGLPMSDFSVNLDGSVRIERHVGWLEMLAKQDKGLVARMNNSGTVYVTSNDVLLGKGRAYQDWAGNRFFNSLVDERRADYQMAASKAAKTRQSNELVRYIQTQVNGRFLRRRLSGEWEVADERTARAKAAHALRRKGAAGSSDSKDAASAFRVYEDGAETE